MRRVEPDRHQQRLHLLAVELAHPAALRLVALAVDEDGDTGLAQRGHHLLVKTRYCSSMSRCASRAMASKAAEKPPPPSWRTGST